MTKSKPIALALAPAVMLAFTGCKTHTEPSPFAASNPNTSIQAGVPGGVVVDSYYDVSARVTAIGAGKRTLTIVGGDGKSSTFSCGPEVRNFDQIRVGDRIKVRLTELLIAAVGDPNKPSPDGKAALVVLAPQGAIARCNCCRN